MTSGYMKRCSPSPAIRETQMKSHCGKPVTSGWLLEWGPGPPPNTRREASLGVTANLHCQFYPPKSDPGDCSTPQVCLWGHFQWELAEEKDMLWVRGTTSWVGAWEEAAVWLMVYIPVYIPVSAACLHLGELPLPSPCEPGCCTFPPPHRNPSETVNQSLSFP